MFCNERSVIIHDYRRYTQPLNCYFQVAVAGAPVTLWQFYDTGYTERYMGNPDVNEQDYDLGSVAMQADRFPSE